ncbi:hypothetical protein D9757_000908 [Collybiopsis confluens]|uniref:Zn(2)-C6 fungal-type domain-containing protein n=1 Tax=Collybiopsis confluens TaxID=2823264 RepID=A0A8H5MG53_9AGAR|nr:hypothetical protein D9757_000908 [Collybiopsis confluens]
MTKASPIKITKTTRIRSASASTSNVNTNITNSGSVAEFGGGTGRALRGKGSYASQACNVCKRKKVKCDEVKPVCGSCASSGRREECAWTGESARKPRTEAHFEALRQRAEALERYANILETMLDKCRKEHGGIEMGFSKDSQDYLQFRPQDTYEYGYGGLEGTVEVEELGSDEEVDAICVAAQNFTLDGRDLVLYGNAAPFRFANPKINHASIIPDVEMDLGARYMLMVEGADLAHYNPDFDWSRYLPSQVPLDRREHDRVLDLLFKFFTSWCMRIVPVLFLRDMYRYLNIPRTQTPPKTSHYSPMLHNALLALATGFSDNRAIRDYKSRKYFADEAKRLMESEVQTPNVSVVHALSILGSFHSSNGSRDWDMSILALEVVLVKPLLFTHQAKIVGLSVDCSAWVKSGLITEHDLNDRNWAFWTTLTQEMCWCLYVGRDSNLLTSSEGNSIPVPYIDAAYDQIPWFHPTAEREIQPQPNYLSTTFAATCELMIIAKRVMGVVNLLHVSSNRREVKDEQISSIDLQLHAWKGALPTEIDITLANKNTSTPHKLMMHLAFWWIFILLHRPFFHRKKRSQEGGFREIDHVKICKRAADNIMELLGIYRTLYTLRYVPVTPIQIAFAAGTVYVLLAVQAMSGLRVAKKELQTYVAQAELCVQYLVEMGKSWRCSEEIADILRGLMKAQLKPALERRETRDREKTKERSNDSDNDTSATSEEGCFTEPIFAHFPLGGPSEASSSYATVSSPSSFMPDSATTSQTHDDFLNDMLFEADPFTSSPPSGSGLPHSTTSFILHGLTGFGSASDTMVNAHPNPGTFDTSISSMETGGFLAMLGGETMGHAPCIPPFSSSSFMDADTSMRSWDSYFSVSTSSGADAETSSVLQTGDVGFGSLTERDYDFP